MTTTYVVQVSVGAAWVDDPAQKDRTTDEAAREYFKAHYTRAMRIIRRRVVEEPIPPVKP